MNAEPYVRRIVAWSLVLKLRCNSVPKCKAPTLRGGSRYHGRARDAWRWPVGPGHEEISQWRPAAGLRPRAVKASTVVAISISPA
jgi:hypothetical protein